MINEKVKVYGHPTCPMVPPVLGMLKQSNVEYDYINIHADDEARLLVKSINNGDESVPTLIFPDGSTLTEPSAGQLKRKLSGLGYNVPLLAMLYGNIIPIMMMVIIIYAVISFLGII